VRKVTVQNTGGDQSANPTLRIPPISAGESIELPEDVAEKLVAMDDDFRISKKKKPAGKTTPESEPTE